MTDSEFEVRIAVAEDAGAIAQVNYSTWRHAYHGLIPKSEFDSLNIDLLTETWNQNLEKGDARSMTYVALEGDRLIAYSRFYPSTDSDYDPIHVATIGSIYVDPQFQARGVGRRLMDVVIDAARECDFTELTLHVLETNSAARVFYEKLGWNQDLEADFEEATEESVPKVRYRRRIGQ